ncbi:MAG TPA: neutral zinc metallopeptidase [Mycobacteriales bacterium]|nr:neutral zinc metallopeptidase [Mycobacteriales bacterium]
MGRIGRRWRNAVCVLAVAGMGASACTETVPGVGSFSPLKSSPDARIPIRGLPNGRPTAVDRIAGNAISDIQHFWSTEMPAAFGKNYRPVSGGIYSVDPRDSGQRVPCVDKPADILGNAFYCPTADAVAWDRVGLLPTLDKQFGPFPIAMVLAHELGHAIQSRTSEPGHRTIVIETQADCYAGVWTRAAQEGRAAHFQVDSGTLDEALGGYLLFRDPVGSDPNDRQAHGNAFDRVSAFQEGYEQGVAHCKAFNDSRQFTELPFQQPADAADGGNESFAQSMRDGPNDLAAFWQARFDAKFGRTWRPITAVRGYDGSSDSGRPRCAGHTVTQAVQYCPADRTLYFDGVQALPDIYRRTGDFGPMALIAVGYGQAVRDELGRSITGTNALTNEICLAGGYAGVVSRRNGANELTLSPGDLDEAVQALLSFGGTAFGEPGSSGFARIKAFRSGFASLDNCH